MRVLWVLSLSVAAMAQEVCAPTPLYSICDVVFDASPDEVKQLQAEVKSPRFRTSLVPAFWDGGRKWIIRFTPMDPGTYEFRLTSNLPQYNGKVGSMHATPSDHPGFIRPANVHHWIHQETIKPHLWMGGVNHVRETLPASDDPATLRAFEQRLKAAHAAGQIVDLTLAATPLELMKRFPTRQDREKWLRGVVSRFAPYDITWLLVGQFEDAPGGRALLRELAEGLKKMDPYNHVRGAGSKFTSSGLSADGWVDYITVGSDNDILPMVEHQFYSKPFVATAKAKPSSEAFRKQLWNATMSGQYPHFDGGDPALIKIWKEFFERTRFWELEPWTDVDGGRCLALDETEYILYVEKPSGPVEVATAKHGYDVYWIDPATGQSTKAKDYKGERYVGEPPSKDHDWVLHLSRDGRKQGMLKSYKFESRLNLGQEIEQTVVKVPFEIAEPASDELSLAKPPKFAIKLKRETRATRIMSYVWSGEVVADGEGSRILALGANGQLALPHDLASHFPAVLNIRVMAINANGKAYSLDKVYRLVP